jgi:hypothetical protein
MQNEITNPGTVVHSRDEKFDASHPGGLLDGSGYGCASGC